MADVLVPIGDHRPSSVPAPLSDDVHLRGEEGVGGPNDTADVEVVLPVLDGDMEPMATGVEVGDDRVPSPVAVAIDDIPPVTAGKELWVESRVVRPRLGVRAYSDDIHVEAA